MNVFMKDICLRYDFPLDYIEEIDIKLKNNKCFLDLTHNFLLNPSDGSVWDKTKELAKETGINEYSLNMMLLLYCLEPLYKKYIENGLPSQLFYDTMEDLKYKANECMEIYNVFGTFVAPEWYYIFYTLDIFKFGRLEFARSSFHLDNYEKGNIKLKKGDKVIAVHIPSSGKLLIEDCEKSFKIATEFFGKETDDNKVIFICSSWLLFDKHREMLGENSNIVKFMRLFEIIENGEDNYDNLWRIFGKDFQKSVDELPENTSVQKAYKKLMLQGNKSGYGTGIKVMYKNK